MQINPIESEGSATQFIKAKFYSLENLNMNYMFKAIRYYLNLIKNSLLIRVNYYGNIKIAIKKTFWKKSSKVFVINYIENFKEY